MTMKRLLIFSLFCAGCATADDVQELEDKVTALEAKVEQLSARPAAAPPGRGQAPAAADPAKEAEAQALFEAANAAITGGDYDTAKAKLAELKAGYSATQIWRRAQKLEAEVAVIGNPAPSSLDVSNWLVGESVDISGSNPTMLVFFEEWCPHCKREVPNLINTYNTYKDRGLQVVGLTKVTRRSTDESVAAFLADSNVNYPVGKESGAISTQFNVSGIPAAAVVKDGVIVWRGHPARLSNAMIEGWL